VFLNGKTCRAGIFHHRGSTFQIDKAVLPGLRHRADRDRQMRDGAVRRGTLFAHVIAREGDAVAFEKLPGAKT